MGAGTIILIVVIVFFVIILIAGIAMSAGGDSTDPTDDPTDVPSVTSTRPTITKATGTYVKSEKTSQMSVTGTNFKSTSTFSFSGGGTGTISYISPTSCTIYLDYYADNGYLVIMNGSNKSEWSDQYYVKLTETSSTTPEDTSAKIKTDKSNKSGSTESYYWWLFNTVVSDAKVEILQEITEDDDFGILCVAGGGGGSGGGTEVHCGGGGGGCAMHLTGVEADVKYYFLVGVGAGGAGGAIDKDGSTGGSSYVKYYDSNKQFDSQVYSRGGKGGTRSKDDGTGGDAGEREGSADVSLKCDTLNYTSGGKYGKGGSGGENGTNLRYINVPTSADFEFSYIPYELISADIVKKSYGGGGGGSGTVDEKTFYSSGEGGKYYQKTNSNGNATSDEPVTYGKSGTRYDMPGEQDKIPENVILDGQPGTHYGAGGGAGGSINYFKVKYPGGAGYNGMVFMYIKK